MDFRQVRKQVKEACKGFTKAESMTESEMLDYASEYGFVVCE